MSLAALIASTNSRTQIERVSTASELGDRRRSTSNSAVHWSTSSSVGPASSNVGAPTLPGCKSGSEIVDESVLDIPTLPQHRSHHMRDVRPVQIKPSPMGTIEFNET